MFGWFKSRTSASMGPKKLSLQEQVRQMKCEALIRAREAVRQGREPAAFDDKPGLSHYIRAMRQVCGEYGVMLPARSILDLSGLTIEGFSFTADDFALAQDEIDKLPNVSGLQGAPA